MNLKLRALIQRILTLNNILNLLYILLIVASFLIVPYHNIRTGYTNWSLTGFGARGPINAGALAVQRALTFALIVFYLYNLRLKRKIRNESFEIDLAIKESEDRRHLVEKEYFKLKRQIQNVFDAMDDLVFISSKDYTIEFMNKALKRDFGEGVGKKCHEILFNKNDICEHCFGDRVFKGEFVISERKHEQNQRIYSIRSSPLINPDGSISKVTILHDITKEREIQRELKSSKEHLEKIMETPQNLIVELDKDMRIKMFNKGCEEVTGYSRSEVIGKDWAELFIPDRLRDTIKMVFEQVKSESNIFPSQYENPILTKSGKERIIFWSNTKLVDEKGELISVICIGEDITVRKRAQQKISDSEEKYRTFLENAPVHVGVTDESGKFIIWNDYSEKMFGYQKQEVIGRMVPADLHETAQEAKEVIDIAASKGEFDGELNLVHKDGSKIPVRLVVVPRIKDQKTIGFCGFALDISRRKITEKELLATKEKLESIALIDPLTELFNARYLNDRLVSEFERSKRSLEPLSLLFVDLDYFKSINDNYGHDFGDKVLIQVAKLLKTELRANDIVARWGGEEFMIILSEVGRNNAIIVAKKVLRLFKFKGFGDEKNIVNLKCSIGIVSYPEDPLFTPAEMIEAVEKSVLKVKTSGGDGIGSYIYGLIKEDDRAWVSEKDRLLSSLKRKMEFFAIKGEDSTLEAIYSLSKSLELKDHTTRRHADMTIHYAIKLAQRLGMSEREIENVKRAAILHDIGKLGIPDKILLKEGPLTKAEFEIVKQHPKIAAEIISSADFLKESVPYVLYHHERYNGEGYPDGLKGEEIPLGARIISVVDVFEALTSDRPYHKAMSRDDAIKEIRNNIGSQFDPRVTEEFLDLIEKESQEKA